jgi:hypothetical protein
MINFSRVSHQNFTFNTSQIILIMYYRNLLRIVNENWNTWKGIKVKYYTIIIENSFLLNESVIAEVLKEQTGEWRSAMIFSRNKVDWHAGW